MPSPLNPPPPPKADVSPTPPNRIIRRDLTTPCQTDGYFVELVDITSDAFQKLGPIKRGTPYATVLGAEQRIIDEFAGNPLYFAKQIVDLESMRVAFNGQYINSAIWIWVSQTLSQNSYNSRITYVDESVSVPRFERVSTVKRNVWEANPTLAYKSALSAMISVGIVAGGHGYGALDRNGQPEPTIGTIGNAVALGVVDATGAIIDWIVTVEGSNIHELDSLTIQGSGSGGLAQAHIQPPGAILLHQEKRELPDSDPLAHDYVQIIQTWEVVPGVTLVEDIYDASTNTIVTRSKTKKLTANITPGAETITVGSDTFVQITTREPIDNNVSWEVVMLQPQPENHDLGSALQTTSYAPFQFPATLDVTLYNDSVGFLGYMPAFTRRCKHQTFTWWEVTDTEPDITSLMETLASPGVGGIPILGGIYEIQGGGNLSFGVLSEIIYDAVTLAYSHNGFIVAIDWPGSDPDLTTYLADWIPSGKPARAVIGDVNPDGNFFRWKVQVTFVHFLIEPQGTIVP